MDENILQNNNILFIVVYDKRISWYSTFKKISSNF